MNKEQIEYIRQSELECVADDLSDHAQGFTVLHHIVTEDGTSAMVYDLPDGMRVYRAMEYALDTDEGEEDDDVFPTQQYGYVTTEKHHYMGERYRNLWGEYEGEVYFGAKESVSPQNTL